MSAMPNLTGGCLCGKIRYRAGGEPKLTGVCHCTHCQRQSGSAFSVFVLVPRASLAVEGTPAVFHDVGDSGRPVLRHFCRDCGSPIFSEIAGAPNHLVLKAGTLDDRSWLKPTMHLWCDSAQPWLPIDETAQRYPKGR